MFLLLETNLIVVVHAKVKYMLVYIEIIHCIEFTFHFSL